MKRRKTDFKANVATIAAIATILVLTLSAVPAIGMEESGVPEKLVVRTIFSPPFAMKKPSGEWAGLSIALLQAVARELGTDFELREYSGVIPIKDAVSIGELDLVPMAAMAESNELIVDFSVPYNRSGSAIAVKAEGEGYAWFHATQFNQ